jgi:hypothetical protein
MDSKVTPDYFNLTKNNRVFFAAIAGANPSAFIGGAAGTPLLGIYNPANSGVDLVLLLLRMNIRTTGTVAQAGQAFSFWGINQGGTAPSGTQTAARNAYSLAQTGSSSYCMLNTANTGALASNLVAPSISVGNAGATAGVNVGVLVDEIKGSIIVSQGSYMAFGAALAMTAGSLDVSLFWGETPA